MKKQIALTLTVLLTLAGSWTFAQGNSAGEIRDRMIKRLDQITELKSSGTIGEDNAGYLKAVSGSLNSTQNELVEQENVDRKCVYEAIARKQGATTELVGKRRAIQIAEQAKPGEYVMDEKGEWKKK